jgi:tetratricopeptide (TPR) repeat protein
MPGAEAADRPVFQAQALNHLKAATSIELNGQPSAEAFYHLAYAHASARAIEPATIAIRAALELAPLHVQSWHLLALLLTAQGDWTGAETALGVGLRIWEEADAASGPEDEMEILDNQEGVEAKDFAAAKATSTQPTAARGRSKPRPDLRQILELRMTANVVAEKLHGHDVALERQQELFLFFSQRVVLLPVPAVKEESVRELSGSFVTVTDSGAGPKGLGESMISGELLVELKTV